MRHCAGASQTTGVGWAHERKSCLVVMLEGTRQHELAAQLRADFDGVASGRCFVALQAEGRARFDG